jgi:hypothetical protein
MGDSEVEGFEHWFRNYGGAIVELAAGAAAKKTVQETFCLLGVDLRDPESVNDFRTGIRQVVSMQKAREQRVYWVRKGAINGVFTIAITLILTGLTYFFAKLKGF